MLTVWALLLTILLVNSTFAVDFSGQVVGVLDGDTIEVLHNNLAGLYFTRGRDFRRSFAGIGLYGLQRVGFTRWADDLRLYILYSPLFNHYMYFLILLGIGMWIGIDAWLRAQGSNGITWS